MLAIAVVGAAPRPVTHVGLRLLLTTGALAVVAGGELVDIGFRGDTHDRHDVWVQALRHLIGSEAASSEAAP
jgi:hypothetical protein